MSAPPNAIRLETPSDATTTNWRSYAQSQVALRLMKQGNTRDAARLYTQALALDLGNRDAQINRIVLRIEEISAMNADQATKRLEYQEILGQLDLFIRDLYVEHWFVAMFNRAAVLDYMAGDLTSDDAMTDMDDGMTTVTTLKETAALALISLDSSQPHLSEKDRERWRAFLGRFNGVSLMHVTIDLRQQYASASKAGDHRTAMLGDWHAFATTSIGAAKINAALPAGALDRGVQYATAILYASAAELAERSKLPDHQAWYEAALKHLEQSITAPGSDLRIQQWAPHDPSLAALRRGRHGERFRDALSAPT